MSVSLILTALGLAVAAIFAAIRRKRPSTLLIGNPQTTSRQARILFPVEDSLLRRATAGVLAAADGSVQVRAGPRRLSPEMTIKHIEIMALEEGFTRRGPPRTMLSFLSLSSDGLGFEARVYLTDAGPASKIDRLTLAALAGEAPEPPVAEIREEQIRRLATDSVGRPEGGVAPWGVVRTVGHGTMEVLFGARDLTPRGVLTDWLTLAKTTAGFFSIGAAGHYGRPGEAAYMPRAFELSGKRLLIGFTGGEVLTVDDPSGFEAFGYNLRIHACRRVVFEAGRQGSFSCAYRDGFAEFKGFGRSERIPFTESGPVTFNTFL